MISISGLIIALTIVWVIMALVRRKKASTPMTELPSRSRQVEMSIPPTEALRLAIRYAQSSGYEVVQLDEANGRAVFADPARSLFDSRPSCFYIVFVRPNHGSGTLMEVGVKSQYWQVVGLDSALDAFVAGLRAAVFARDSDRV